MAKLDVKLSKAGRSYENRRPLNTDLQRAIIDELPLLGGDIITGIFLGFYQTVATKFKVSLLKSQKILLVGTQVIYQEKTWS